jgi:hypothetical protein
VKPKNQGPQDNLKYLEPSRRGLFQTIKGLVKADKDVVVTINEQGGIRL